jgi:two-component system sensor histidine kinase UhpB
MSRNDNALNLLVVEDNLGDYILLEEYLKLTKLPICGITHSSTMGDVAALVKDKIIDLAMLDLSLTDCKFNDSVIRLNQLLPKVPIVVFSGLSDIELAKEAIATGAQDYLIKGEFNEAILAKVIQFSIERKKVHEVLKDNIERYELVVNKATQDIIWEWDLKKNITIRGKGISKLLGYAEEEIDQDFNWTLQKIHPADQERVQKNIEHCLNNNIENWQDEYQLLASDGSYKVIMDRGCVMFNENNESYRMIGAMTDITERRELEKKLLEQKINQQKLITEISLQAQEKEKNVLSLELHDNINQILATAKIYLRLAADKKDMPDGIDLIEDSYSFVVEAMEEIRKLSHSLAAPSLGEIKLQDALRDLVKELNIGKTFSVQLIDEVDLSISIDENKALTFYRIAQEQTNNIIKYAQAKNITIKLSTDGTNFQLSITDDGIGFDTHESTGIGLKNIQKRIEFYAGECVITSSVGNGCKLYVSLPLL